MLASSDLYEKEASLRSRARLSVAETDCAQGRTDKRIGLLNAHQNEPRATFPVGPRRSYNNEVKVSADDMEFFDFGTIFFVVAAAVIFYQLRSVLGRRTGNERPPHDPSTSRWAPSRCA